MKAIILPAIKESTVDYELIEKAIKTLFKREIYLPLMREFDTGAISTLRNSKSVPGVLEALQSGRITFNRGTFSGNFNSEISKQLRQLGATFDRGTKTYKIPLSNLPRNVRHAISASDAKFQDKINKIDKRLGEVVSDELLGKGISKKLRTNHLFDRTLWRVDHEFQRNVKNITIAPKLTPAESKRISDEWGTNLQLWIQDFTKKEMIELREKMQATVFSGNRYGSAVKTIQDSYGVTENKAKFLARQETSLLMAKFKQTRYQSAGIDFYKWGCVAGSKNHPVRPMHLKNKDKVYRWDDPPTVDEQGHKKNPGQDYNCRCFPRPMVNYRGKIG